MADLVQTAANVVIVSGTPKYGTAGGTITAGMPIYKDSADDNAIKPCQSDGTAAEAACDGIALNGASDGQPVTYAPTGTTVNLGATLTVGEIYVLSQTAGGIAPEADLATGDYVTVLGVAITAANLMLTVIASGVEVPA